MAFRADESIRSGYESIKNFLIPLNIKGNERGKSESKLFEIIDEYGPVVNNYPSWHPLVSNGRDSIGPNSECGYIGLDHTRCLLNAFITCPYGDGQKIIDSVDALPDNNIATIRAERLDVQFYQPGATPILVYCDWKKEIELNGMIPASIAVPLMLQKEVPCWDWATRGETWETMRPYLLGSPHGSRSSLFVTQETALTMKKIWGLLINTGMFGPLKVSNQY